MKSFANKHKILYIILLGTYVAFFFFFFNPAVVQKVYKTKRFLAILFFLNGDNVLSLYNCRMWLHDSGSYFRLKKKKKKKKSHFYRAPVMLLA